MLNIIFFRYWQWKGSSENKNCWRPCKRSFRQQRSRRNPGILVWRRNIWIMPTRMQKKVVFLFLQISRTSSRPSVLVLDLEMSVFRIAILYFYRTSLLRIEVSSGPFLLNTRMNMPKGYLHILKVEMALGLQK